MAQEKPVEFSSSDAFIRQNLGDRAQQSIRIARAQRQQQLRQSPIGPDAGKNLLVLDLPRHDGAGHAFSLECLNQFGELAQ